MLDNMLTGVNYGLDDETAKDGNVFLGLINSIMKGSGDAINNILDNSLKFNSKKMELEEINAILVQVTRSCTLKLYPEECGGYSLRSALGNAEFSPTIHDIALSNITYAVMTAVSPIVLGSLFFFFSRDFIFFHIRDGIVEPNYRDYIKEARERYETPNKYESNINTMEKFKNMVSSISETMLVVDSPRNSDHIEEDLNELKRILPLVEPEQAKYIVENDINYPVPGFMMDIICNTVDENTNTNTTNFLNGLKTTFTIQGLRILYKELGGIKTVGESFELKLKKLHEDRLFTNGLSNPVDGLTLEQNITLSKLLIFSSLSDKDDETITDSIILKRVQDCVTLYPVVGTKVSIDNDKLTIINSGTTKIYYYKSDNLDEDLKSPFTIFGIKRKQLEIIYNNEPEKFCINQAILTKKYRSGAFLDGKHEPKTVKEKTTYNSRRLSQLMTNRSISRDTKLLNEISRLRSGDITKLKYVNQNWFGNMVVDDPKRAVLILAEMEGLKNQIARNLNNRAII